MCVCVCVCVGGGMGGLVWERVWVCSNPFFCHKSKDPPKKAWMSLSAEPVKYLEKRENRTKNKEKRKQKKQGNPKSKEWRVRARVSLPPWALDFKPGNPGAFTKCHPSSHPPDPPPPKPCKDPLPLYGNV